MLLGILLRLLTQSLFSEGIQTWLGGIRHHGGMLVALRSALGYALLRDTCSQDSGHTLGSDVPYRVLGSNTHHGVGNELRNGPDCGQQHDSPIVHCGIHNHYIHSSKDRKPDFCLLMELELALALGLEWA